LHQQNKTGMSKKNYFSHKDSFEKQQARLFAASHYKGGRILSLSASNFVFEQLMANRTKDKIDAVEYSLTEYKQGRKLLREIKQQFPQISYEFENIYNKDAAKYRYIFLDLCQAINTQNIPQICSWLKDFNGVVCITLQRAREYFDDKYYELNGAVDVRDFRDRVFPKIIEQFTGLKQVCDHYDYKNRTNLDGTKIGVSTPMRIYTFAR
jgi:hypothetical protein